MHTCKIKTLTINTWAVGVGNRWLGFPIKSWRVTRHKTIAYKNCSPSWKSHGWHRIGRKGLKYHSSQLQLETQGFYSNLALGKANTSNSHNSIHRSRNEMASLHQLFKKVGWRLVQSLISWSGSLWICDSIPGAERQNLRNKSPFNSVWPETRREFDAGYKLEPRPRPGWHDAKIRLTNTLPAIGNTGLLPWHGYRMQSDHELSREGEGVMKSCHYPQAPTQWCLIRWRTYLASLTILTSFDFFLSFLNKAFFGFPCESLCSVVVHFLVCSLLSSAACSSKLLFGKITCSEYLVFWGFLSQVWPKMLSELETSTTAHNSNNPSTVTTVTDLSHQVDCAEPD